MTRASTIADAPRSAEDPRAAHTPGSADDVARACARTLYTTDLTAQQLGIEVDGVAAGRATATMTVADHMVNGHGTCHGGYVFLLADTAFAFACNTHDVVTVAATADIAFLRPAHPGDRLVATAVERTRAGRSGIYDVTVVRAGDGDVVAEFRGGSRSLRDPVLPRDGHADDGRPG